jgi:ribosomal protein L40E
MTVCPSCNTPNEDSAQFCINCGTPLVAPPQPEGAVACPSCGAANPPDAQFCVKCGTPLNAAVIPGNEQPAAESVEAPSQPTPDFAPTPPEAPVPPEPKAAPASPLFTTAAGAAGAAAAPGASSRKELGLALMLEILPALVGFFGIGWIYSGNVTVGIVLLIGMLLWEGLGLVVALFSFGIGCLCLVPINLVVIAVSAYLLYGYARQHPELFSA